MRPNDVFFVSAFVHLLENGCTVTESLDLLAGDPMNRTISTSAADILSAMKKGESFGSALQDSKLMNDESWTPYILQFSQTGNILASFLLIRECMERKSEQKRQFVQALVYPLFIFVTTILALVSLFIAGIPWMQKNGLVTDATVLLEMRKGTVYAFLCLAVCTIFPAASVIRLFRIKESLDTFWALLVSAGNSGLTFEQSLEICRQTQKVTYRLDGSNYFFNSPNMDSFTHTSIRTAMMTGNFQSAFESIAHYHAKNLAVLYSFFAKLIEPFLMGITGIVIMVLAIYVFLPLFNQTAGGIK